ncbi:MAG: hypothetical protein J6V01_03135 [Clostridia bacterium]|nr:hypothetical protein [Clostridia bacterium]
MKNSLARRGIASVLLAAIFLLGLIPAGIPVSAEEEFTDYVVAPEDTGWYDAAASEYTISTKGELAFFATLAKTNNFAGKTVKLGADIVWTEGEASSLGFTPAPGAELNSWQPIGPSTSNPFQGTFDGQGHTISGIYMHTNRQNAGLFGVVKNSVIKNLTLSNCCISLYKDGDPNPSWAGIVVSNSWGDNEMSGVVVSDCYIIGDPAESSYLGGLVGCAASASGTNLYKNCAVTGGFSGKDAVGGLVGLVRNKKTVVVENCVCTADIAAATDCAGIIGWLCGLCEMRNVLFLGTVTCTDGAKSAGLCYLEKKDQGGTAQVDFSTALFEDCYTQSDLRPAAAPAGEVNFEVSTKYGEQEAEKYELLGTAADADAISGLFESYASTDASSNLSLAAAQSYEADGKFGARLVASVKDLGQAKYAGFRVSVLKAGGDINMGMLYCSQVFGMLEARGGADALSSSAFGGGHLFALSFKGIPAEGSAIFAAAPFTGADKTSPVFGKTAVAVFVNGAFVCLCNFR